jgi:hypothetical protein
MTTDNNDALVVREDSLPTKALAETIIDIDDMYSIIGRTLSALLETTVDGGESVLDPDMQAHNHKGLLPDTELEMMHSQALPLSEDDVKAFKQMQARQNTVQYRRKQFQIPTMTLAEITGARIRVGYRLLRYMAHVRGIGAIGQPLIFTLGSSNAQINCFEIPIEYNPTVGIYNGMAAVRNLLALANEGPYRYSYLINGEHYVARGMSILPPPIHDGYYPQNAKPLWEYRRSAYTPSDYRADTDAPLAIYLNMCELLVRHLGIAEDDIEEQAAVQALLNPKIARLAWPCRDDIETFEESVLLPYIGKIFASRSQDSAIEFLMKGEVDRNGEVVQAGLGLTHTEAFDLLETYKTYAQEVNVFDPEKERSPAISKLQKLAEECSDAGMVTTELNAHRTFLQILGLTKHDEDTNVDKRAALGSVLEAEIVEKTQKNSDGGPQNTPIIDGIDE